MASALPNGKEAVHKLVDEGHCHMWQKVNAAAAEANVGHVPADLPIAQVPEVDISCFVFPECATQANRDAVVEQVLATSRSLGFMNIVGHGVPRPIVDSIISALSTFFQSPMEQKQRCIARSGHGTSRGYAPYKTESINAVLGREGPADLREVYSFGPPCHLGGSAYGANTYPDFIDGFSQRVDGYYAEMQRVEKVMLEIFSRALAKAIGQPLDPQHLFKQIQPNRGLLKAAWSPPCEPSPDDVRCAAHTDWGPLTILLTTSPGLEVCVRSQDGGRYQWQSVPVVPGALTVNVADQLARWSNDRFVSCVHRVNANVSCDLPRISVPYFSTQILPLRAKLDPKVECICGDGEEPKYEPLSIRDYLCRNFRLLQVAGRSGGS